MVMAKLMGNGLDGKFQQIMNNGSE